MPMCLSNSQDDASMTMCLSNSQDDASMTMCLSNSQDDDSMVRFSIEKHGISRVVGELVAPHLSGVRASLILNRATCNYEI
jgi:hypothetical protein